MSDLPLDATELAEALQLSAGDTFAPDVGQRIDPAGDVSYFLGIGDLRIAVGVATLVIPAGSEEGFGGLAHGLAVVPQSIQLTSATPPAGSFRGAFLSVTGADETSFGVHARAPGYVGGTPLTFHWLAIG